MLNPGRGHVMVDGPLVSVNVGVTRWFSLGAGTIPIGDLSNRPYWVIPKVRVASRGNTTVALCIAHASVFEDGSVGLVYVVSTTGTGDRSFSIGVATAYLQDDNGEGNDNTGTKLAALVGGERRIHPRWSVVTENYVTTVGGVTSVGSRLHRRHFTAAFSVVASFEFSGDLLVFPAVSLGWKF